MEHMFDGIREAFFVLMGALLLAGICIGGTIVYFVVR